MKRVISILMCAMVLLALIPAVSAATEPVILLQPQNARFPAGSDAEYTVVVYGEHVKCTWYLEYNGETIDLSDYKYGYIGAEVEFADDSNTLGWHTFCHGFTAIREDLDGAEVYAVIEDGHFLLETDRAIISVGGSAMPPVTKVPPSVTVKQGTVLNIFCEVKQQSGVTYEYLWYESGNGKLQDIMVIGGRTGEEQTNDTLRVDTSEVGTRYYVCSVHGSNGGSAYTSVIPVTVTPGHSVLFTADSNPVPGGRLTVDIKAMTGFDERVAYAYEENQVVYTWYRDGKILDDEYSKTLKLDHMEGCDIYVEVVCYDLIMKSEVFHIPEAEGIFPDILTQKLPDAVAGESYSVKLECADPDAEFGIWYNPGKANDFEKTGLTLTENGEIRGVPKAAGTYGFCVTACNSEGEGYMAYTLTVREPAPPATTAPVETTVPTETTVPVETTEPVATTEPEATTEPAQPTEPAAEPEKASSPVPMILGIVGGAVVGGGGVAYFVLRKKRG